MIGYISGVPNEQPTTALSQQPSMEEMAAQARDMMEVRSRVLKFQQNPDAFMQRYGGRAGVRYLKEDADRVGIPFTPPTDWSDAGLAFVNELGMGIPGLFSDEIRDASANAPGWAKAAGVAGSMIAGGALVAGAKVAGSALLRKAAIKAVAKAGANGARSRVVEAGIGKALKAYEETGALPNAGTLRFIERGMTKATTPSTGLLEKAGRRFDWVKKKVLGGADEVVNTSVDDLLKSVDDAAEQAIAKATVPQGKRAAARAARGVKLEAAEQVPRRGTKEYQVWSIRRQAELHKKKILLMEQLRTSATQKGIMQHMGEGAAGLAVQATLPAAERAWEEGRYLPTEERLLAATTGGFQGAMGGATAGMTAGAFGQAPRLALGAGAAAIGVGTVTQSPEMALWGAAALVPGLLRGVKAPVPQAMKVAPMPASPMRFPVTSGVKSFSTPGGVKAIAELKAASLAAKKAASLAKRRATIAAKKAPQQPSTQAQTVLRSQGAKSRVKKAKSRIKKASQPTPPASSTPVTNVQMPVSKPTQAQQSSVVLSRGEAAVLRRAQIRANNKRLRSSDREHPDVDPQVLVEAAKAPNAFIDDLVAKGGRNIGNGIYQAKDGTAYTLTGFSRSRHTGNGYPTKVEVVPRHNYKQIIPKFGDDYDDKNMLVVGYEINKDLPSGVVVRVVEPGINSLVKEFNSWATTKAQVIINR